LYRDGLLIKGVSGGKYREKKDAYGVLWVSMMSPIWTVKGI